VICSYERGGYGWSDPGPEPRTSSEIARELKTLLEAAGERGPYVIVGHSFGGFNVRVFTSLYSADVAGVVLVEGSHEDEDQRMMQLLPASVIEREAKADQRNERINRIMGPLRDWLGIQRMQIETGWGTPDYGMQSSRLPKRLREEFLYLRQQAKFEKAVAAEGRAFPQSVAEIRKAGGLGDRPPNCSHCRKASRSGPDSHQGAGGQAEEFVDLRLTAPGGASFDSRQADHRA
jgi:pimeloyl-ACP methyl ester carboxylesterase